METTSTSNLSKASVFSNNTSTLSPTKSTESGNAYAENRFNSDFESFLSLLTAQMQNQDPLAPMDSSQFVNQLAQLSQVEQSVKTNTNLEAVLAALKTSSDRADLSFLGKTVQTESSMIPLKEGTSEFSYVLDGDTQYTSIVITKEDGTPVRSLEGSTTGLKLHDVTWDGKDDNGNPVADGLYKIQITAKDAAENDIGSSVAITDQVKKIVRDDMGTVLILDSGISIGTEQVISVES